MSIPIDSTWTLTFDDEFNGTALDGSKWGDNWLGADGAITKPVNSQELAAYDPAQVSVYGGYLHLTAIESPVTVNGIDYQYRSGLVQTHDSFHQTYGYFEAKIFVPGTNGKITDWPAFWLDGENWPYDGELDVMEGLGGSAAYHFHSPSGGPGKSVSGDYTGWHVFGAMWEPGKVSYYYDNVLVGEITSGITDSPMYLILNLGVGVNSIKQIPAEMMVDWVHVYSSNSSAVAVTPQSGYTGPGGTGTVTDTTTTTDGTQTITGTNAADTLVGTTGMDDIYGKGGNDSVQAMRGDDLLDGGDGDDTLGGGQGNDIVLGGAGKDTLHGAEGNDRLIGGLGADRVSGELGADIFVFDSLADSSGKACDTILDFDHAEGDVVDLSGIDANAKLAGDQAFDFLGRASFTKHPGELYYKVQGSSLYVYGDVDGDGRADFAIKFQGISSLAAGDFIL